MQTKTKRVKEPDPRIPQFLRWFSEEYRARQDGADYLIVWGRDSKMVEGMLGATSYARLQKLALLLLTADADPFINQSDRGIPVLSMKFNWLSARLAQWERARGLSSVREPGPDLRQV